jgi:hypothetical protein
MEYESLMFIYVYHIRSGTNLLMQCSAIAIAHTFDFFCQRLVTLSVVKVISLQFNDAMSHRFT